MAGTIATIPKFQFSAFGEPLVGGTLTTYLAGTTTPVSTFQNQALTIANTNPIVLDARGECVLWLDSAKVYKFVLANALGVIQWTQDNISGAGNNLASFRTELGAAGGASLVGYGATTVESQFNAMKVKLSATDSQTAARTTDGSVVAGASTQAITADEIYEGAIGPGGVPAPGWDAVRGVMDSPPGTTVLTSTGVAGYIKNRTVQGAFGTNNYSGGVALFGVGISAADNTSTWGIDTICSDNVNQVLSSGVGRACYNEFDFNMTSPNSTASGLIIGGTWLAQPASATGVTIFKPNGVGRWQYAFGTQNGAAIAFIRCGAIESTGVNINSQNIDMYWKDSAGVDRFTEIQAQPGGIIIASSVAPNGTTTPGSLILANGGLYLRPIQAPNTPGQGMVIYIDQADNRLKARASTGTITNIALP